MHVCDYVNYIFVIVARKSINMSVYCIHVSGVFSSHRFRTAFHTEMHEMGRFFIYIFEL